LPALRKLRAKASGLQFALKTTEDPAIEGSQGWLQKEQKIRNPVHHVAPC
jgi:hypothetical protein